MQATSIEWTDATFNPWSGCTKVSAGCQNCYAETNYSVKMRGVKWGPNGSRKVASEAYWKEPLRWNKLAQEGICPTCRGKKRVTVPCNEYGGEDGNLLTTINRKLICTTCHGTGQVGAYRSRVFCASLADVFEDWRGPMVGPKGEALRHDSGSHPAPWRELGSGGSVAMQHVRERLFRLIDQTPSLDWLLLTKRPENVLRMTYDAWAAPVPGHVSQNPGDGRYWKWPKNVWMGVSVEDQRWADERIPLLLQVPAAVRFLSCEPLLSAVDLRPGLAISPEHGEYNLAHYRDSQPISWVIAGGESGPGARPCDLEWIRGIVQQCQAAGVAAFVKQAGSKPFMGVKGFGPVIKDRKGGTMEEWPEDLRVREFPAVEARP